MRSFAVNLIPPAPLGLARSAQRGGFTSTSGICSTSALPSTHINANTDIDTSGTGVPAPNTAAALNDLALPAIQDEQSPLKKEIVFLLDDPDGLIKTLPQLQVNTQNPMPISKNSPFIYPLDDTQKQGPIQFLYPLTTGAATTVLHPQIRNINVQRNSPVQMPKAWFTKSGKLPAYAGFQTVPGTTGVDFNDADSNVVMLAVTDAPPAELQTAQGYQINALADDSVRWIMKALYSVNRNISRLQTNEGAVSEESRWHWDVPSVSDIALLFKDGVKAFAIEDNRQFIAEFFHAGQFVVKEVKGQWMLVFKGQAGLRTWVKGAAYSIEGAAAETNKVRIFKTYAKMMTNDSKFSKAAVLAENAVDDSPLAFIIIAPVDIIQYFFFDKDPNKQISDLFVNIGLDLATAVVAGALATVLVIALAALATLALGVTVGAGLIVVAGIATAALFGYLLHVAEEDTGLTRALIKLGRKAENHFLAQGDQLKIEFETFSTESANVLTRVDAAQRIAATITNAMSHVP